jgi:hypothetical protein
MMKTKFDESTYDWVICRFMDAIPDTGWKTGWYDLIEELTDQAWADAWGIGINQYQEGYN